RGTPCGGLLAALREDPLTPRMMPHLIDTPELTGQLVWQSCRASEHRIDTWHGTYAALAAEGVLDRADLMATAVTILLRGTWPLGGVRFCVALLRALEPTADEYAARTGDWIRIAADAPSVAAVYAQEVLRGLWDTDRLTSAQLAETARAVFFRTEKQPVRGQLSWLEAALRRTPQDAPVLLPALGDAFGYADTTLQQRALRLAGRHLTHAGPAAREELIGAAALLRPGLLTTAADLFDAPELLPERTGPRDRPRDTLPEPRAAAPLPPAPQSAEEFTAEFAAVLAASLRSRATVASYEWVLDGMVRLAHRDREALAKALEPLAQRHADWLHHNNWPRYGGFNLLALLAAATGPVSSADIKRVRRATAHKDCPHARFSTPWRRRLAEITALLVTGPVPPHLLATPSRDSGELHPEDLLTRLHLYVTQGAEPAPADLDLALLRLRHPADPATLADLVARAHALDTPEGRRLARWLETPPKPAPAAERTLVKSAKDRTRIQLTEAASRELNRAFPALSAVGDGFRPGTRYCGCVYRSARYWVSLCPDRPDTLAVHLIPLLAEAAVGTERIDTGLLLTLAEAPGPPGPALHLALAHGLSARHPDDRLATVDALLTLAARDLLDAHRLGTDLAELLSLGAVKANRVADAFTTLVSANAPATAWSVLAALLPPLLATEAAPPRGTGDLLAAAATGAEECGARDSAPWLTDLATRKGGSRLLTEARRLHQALTG
ncbi:DUF6493 family protein, partial [Streptomyces sp. NPDC059477]|uniref:DUF7824 domain-containing protein n=1 Tax=Streptomyces sp. NPDC059477 TaxID=3346847 RepID=UPI0036923599